MTPKKEKELLERYLEKLNTIKLSNHVNVFETEQERATRLALVKKDYKECVKYYFPHYATCECADFQIEAANFIKKHKNCVDAEIWARGHAKSTHLTIMIPFWLWINDELDVFLLIGKNADDAKTLLSDLQAEFESNPQIIADYGEQKNPGHWEIGQFVTLTKEVAFYSLGREQSPRGIRYKQKRPNMAVLSDIDDKVIANNLKRVLKVISWIFGALFGAFDNRGARIVFDNNYFTNTGIISFVIKRILALSKHNKSARVNIVNALDKKGNPTWYQKYTKAFFKEKQQIMGDFDFQSEYMNNPQVEGKIFLDEQIQWATLPRLDSFDCIVGHWDVAYAGTSTGDYNAVKVWGIKDSKFYCIAAFVRQCKMGIAMQWMIDFERSLPKSVKVHWRFESQFWNDALKMTLADINDRIKPQEDGEHYQLRLIQCERPVTNKFNRILRMQPYYQNGKIYYNKKEEFNVDMQVGINQLKAIEPGYSTHDDSPDADEGALSFLEKFIPNNNPLPILGYRSESSAAW